jgi:hypothetical protein
LTSDPGVQQRICCGDARQRVGIEQLGHQVLQQRRVRLRIFEAWICERNPVSLGPALRQSDEFSADGAAFAADSAAPAGGTGASEQRLSCSHDVPKGWRVTHKYRNLVVNDKTGIKAQEARVALTGRSRQKRDRWPR